MWLQIILMEDDSGSKKLPMHGENFDKWRRTYEELLSRYCEVGVEITL